MSDYEGWTVEELKAEASERELEGRSAMNKEELVAALEADDAEEPSADAEVVSGPTETDEILEVARAKVVDRLKELDDALEADDHTDPARYQALKDERAVALDALNHHLTLKEEEA